MVHVHEFTSIWFFGVRVYAKYHVSFVSRFLLSLTWRLETNTKQCLLTHEQEGGCVQMEDQGLNEVWPNNRYQGNLPTIFLYSIHFVEYVCTQTLKTKSNWPSKIMNLCYMLICSLLACEFHLPTFSCWSYILLVLQSKCQSLRFAFLLLSSPSLSFHI